MTIQQFTEKGIDQIIENEAVTILSGWTEDKEDAPFDAAAYKQKLFANHDAYMEKINEALDNVFNPQKTVK